MKGWLLKERSTGCGPAWWPQWICDRMFSWMFEASCIKHDIGYGRGGTEEDRKRCDDLFYAAMLRDIERLSMWRRPVGHVVAWSFYQLVRRYGAPNFNYHSGSVT